MERTQQIIEDDWDFILNFLPSNLDEIAIKTGAVQRWRQISSGADLLHLVLMYAVGDLSLRHTSAMRGLMKESQQMSDVAILKRLRACPEFLRYIITALLARRLENAPRGELRVCLRDASTISSPGSTGADWRLHVTFDLTNFHLHQVELTDAGKGESFKRVEPQENDLTIVDRAYGTTPGIAYQMERGSQFIARTSLQQIQLESLEQTPADLYQWLGSVPDGKAGECTVGVFGEDGIVRPLRLVAVRKSPEKAEQAVKRAIRESRRKGHEPREQTIILARYILLLTNCPSDLTAEDISELYRFRWQVELEFKRLKSLLFLDQLRAKDPDLAQAYLLAKILAALVAEELTARAAAFSPWGFQLIPTAA